MFVASTISFKFVLCNEYIIGHLGWNCYDENTMLFIVYFGILVQHNIVLKWCISATILRNFRTSNLYIRSANLYIIYIRIYGNIYFRYLHIIKMFILTYSYVYLLLYWCLETLRFDFIFYCIKIVSKNRLSKF